MVSALTVSRSGSHLISQQIFYFFNCYCADVQSSIFICILPLPTFPFLISDTRDHRTSPSSGTPESIMHSPAAFVVPSPWSLSPAHKSNSDTAELRGLSSLMGSQIISSGIFSLLTLRIPLEILPFHPQHIFSEPNREETNVDLICVSAHVRLIFHSHGQLLCIGTGESSVSSTQLVCAVTR